MNYRLKSLLRSFSKRLSILSYVYKFLSKRRVAALRSQPDDVFLKRKFLENTGKELDLNNPQTFNEKLQFLKIHDRKPVYTLMADKYRAKFYIASIIGEQNIVPSYGAWSKFDDIDFDSLPNQFVLKCNHDCGSVYICENKNDMSKKQLRKMFNRAIKENYYFEDREWPYKDIEPVIFAEKYLGNNDGCGLIDYKLMCFNGNAKCAFTCTNRNIGLNVTFFDMEWQRMPFERYYKADYSEIPKPKNWEKMIEIAENLAKDTTFLRVDFFEVEGNLYVGELTFFPGGGMEVFDPPEWDLTLGDWLNISEFLVQN